MIKRGLTWRDYDCGLDAQAYERNFCKPEDCKTCGWGRKESRRRYDYMMEHGLTKCADGLYRLVMPGKDGGT